MRANPKPYERYKHFKGNLYQIIALAKDSEDGKDLVVYQALYGDYTIYVRELSQFMSPVDCDKYPNAEQTYRFEKLQDEVSVKNNHDGNKESAPEIISDNEVAGQEVTTETSEGLLDPMVEAFLDTDALDEKLNILAGLHHRITKEMLATMAIVSDIELNDGSVEDQYVELRDYLLMKEKFECRRTF